MMDYRRISWLRCRWQRVGAPLALTVAMIPAMLVACERPDPEITTMAPSPFSLTAQSPPVVDEERPPETVAAREESSPVTPFPTYIGTPTPNPTSTLTGQEGQSLLYHRVSAGETLSQIALTYGSTIEELMALNSLEGGDFLSVDQVILVPAGAEFLGPSSKIIPDSEVVWGPGARTFDLRAAISHQGGYLLQYREVVEGSELNGAEIVELVAGRQSVNPRLLLAILEHRSGWVTGDAGSGGDYPLGFVRTGYEGLYQQLNWAANLISLGYYGRSEGGVDVFDVGPDQRVVFAPDINDGTAAIQLFLGADQNMTYDQWLQELGPVGFFATYSRLFGNPFAYTWEPIWPADLEQPPLTLPWGEDETWYFTGGPHGAWASGSAWAALDLTPQDEQLGCGVAQDWITAVADGLIVRSELGSVTLDLDGDGYAGTGWTIFYFHVAELDRIPDGTYARVGDHIGHPSCEGGFSNWSHLHIARAYNGRWVAADGPLPFVLDGWVSQGLGREYDGLLVKGDLVKEACECRSDDNVLVSE